MGAIVPQMVDFANAASASAPPATSSAIFPLIHSKVTLSPSSSLTEGAYPSFSLMRSLLELRPRTPSGPGMCLMGRSLPANLSAIACISFMETISSEPRLTGSAKSLLVSLKMPSTQSSMYVNERVCFPSPHISTSVVAVAALRQKAAGAFSLPPFQVPKGP